MKKLILILCFVMLLGLVSQVTAQEPAFCIERDSNYNLTFTCSDDTQDLGYCSATTTCNISITYPNSTFLVKNNETDNLNNGQFRYRLNSSQTDVSGEYTTRIGCSSNNANDSSSFPYLVNPTGICPTQQRTDSLTRTIYIMFGLSILFFVAFFFVKNKPPVKWTIFIVAFLFFLIALNLVSTTITDEVVNPRIETFLDVFSGASFILYWFCGGLLIIIWLITFIETWIWKKNMNNLRRFGLA